MKPSSLTIYLKVPMGQKYIVTYVYDNHRDKQGLTEGKGKMRAQKADRPDTGQIRAILECSICCAGLPSYPYDYILCSQEIAKLPDQPNIGPNLASVLFLRCSGGPLNICLFISQLLLQG